MDKRLVEYLEKKYRLNAHGEEKQHILELLKMYIPIIQRNIKTTEKLRQSRLHLIELSKECMHFNLERQPQNEYLHICLDCGRKLYKD